MSDDHEIQDGLDWIHASDDDVFDDEMPGVGSHQAVMPVFLSWVMTSSGLNRFQS